MLIDTEFIGGTEVGLAIVLGARLGANWTVGYAFEVTFAGTYGNPVKYRQFSDGSGDLLGFLPPETVGCRSQSRVQPPVPQMGPLAQVLN